ncbi:hypothetical protein GIJ77_06680 [Bifidobacterium longum]|nr:hypothetical protein [Bifidobacterium longum]MBM5829922.1 hypothetical protein [Bifidobacterium longum subsp. suillum]
MWKLDHFRCGSWTIFVVEVGPSLLGKLDTRLRTRLFRTSYTPTLPLYGPYMALVGMLHERLGAE